MDGRASALQQPGISNADAAMNAVVSTARARQRSSKRASKVLHHHVRQIKKCLLSCSGVIILVKTCRTALHKDPARPSNNHVNPRRNRQGPVKPLLRSQPLAMRPFPGMHVSESLGC